MGSGKLLVLLLLSYLQLVASPALQAQDRNSAPTPVRDLIIQPMEKKVPCSTEEFNYFFQVFVRGMDDLLPRTAVRHAYVWPQVEVRSDRSPRQLLLTAPKQDYLGDGFKIGLQQNSWIYLDPQVVYGNYPRLEVKFKPLTRQKIRVEYSQAEYAPVANAKANQERLVKTFGKSGAYIFEHRLGCWRLTQELRSAQTSP